MMIMLLLLMMIAGFTPLLFGCGLLLCFDGLLLDHCGCYCLWDSPLDPLERDLLYHYASYHTVSTANAVGGMFAWPKLHSPLLHFLGWR